jgi:dynein heavy chain
MKMMYEWVENGQPRSFWLPGFFFPQGFLTGVLQNHARKYNIPIDSLQFNYDVQKFDENDADALNAVNNEDGALMGGLFLEGARWDREKQLIQDSFPMEMFSVIII